MPYGSHICKSLYHIKKFFSDRKKNSFCNCYAEVDREKTSCHSCNSDLTKDESKYPIIQQLREFGKRLGFHSKLQHRFTWKKYNQNNIEDIYDVEVYKRHFTSGGILSLQDNISFLWNTDGVPLFKSSKVSIWPNFVVTNELEPILRFQNENMIFAWPLVWK